MAARTCSPTMSQCVFDTNIATDAGGGLYCANGVPTVRNCVFIANDAGDGGAMLNQNASPTVTNCTFHDNTGDSDGGTFWSESLSRPTLRNCIISGVDPDIVSDVSSSTTVEYCLVEGGYTGTGNLDDAPLFMDENDGDLRLAEGSPCIDAGTVIMAPGVDIRGVRRPQGSGIDIGAYEMLVGEDA